MIAANRIPAAAYVRMSTDDQDTSVEQQRAALAEKFPQYEIVDWYIDEGKSGSKDIEKRTDFLRLLKDAKKGKFKVVLCYDLSRFSRLDSIEGAEAKKVLRDSGIKLVTLLEGEIDWTTSTGRIIDTVLSEGQHDYSVRLSNKSLLGKLTAAQKGKLFGQTTPYGLARLVIDSTGAEHHIARKDRFRKPREWQQKYVPGDPQEVEIVRWIFSEFNQRDVSFHQLAQELNEKGVPSPSGGKWIYQTVHDVLRNVRYAGDLSLGRNSAGAFHRVRNGKVEANHDRRMKARQKTTDFVHVKDTHEAIIERSIFDAVQAKVERRWRSGQHSGRAADYPLTGVLYCGRCGKPLYGNDGSSSPKKAKGVRYNCKGIHRNTGCGQWGVKESEILPFIARTLVEQIDHLVLREHTLVPPTETSDVAPLTKKLDRLRGEYDQGLDRFLRMSSAAPELSGDMADKLKGWKEEITKLEDEIHRRSLTDDHSAKFTRMKEWYDSIRETMISLPIGAKGMNGKRYASWPYQFSPSSFRELLHKIECRVDLWWERASVQRYRLVRGRLRVANLDAEIASEHFDGSASLIV